MVYDYVAKFETELFVSAIHSELNAMLSMLGLSVPVSKETINTKMTVTAGPLIADENCSEFCEIQNKEYKKGLESKDFQEKLGKKVKVGRTRFIGYENISEHKEEFARHELV